MVFPHRSPQEVVERLKLMFRYNTFKVNKDVGKRRPQCDVWLAVQCFNCCNGYRHPAWWVFHELAPHTARCDWGLDLLRRCMCWQPLGWTCLT